MTLYERIAEKLGWPLKDVQSISLYGLRELVSPDLADEITLEIKRIRKKVQLT